MREDDESTTALGITEVRSLTPRKYKPEESPAGWNLSAPSHSPLSTWGTACDERGRKGRDTQLAGPPLFRSVPAR